jgi:hypothetical protein
MYLDYIRPPCVVDNTTAPVREIYDLSTKKVSCFKLDGAFKMAGMVAPSISVPILHMTMLYFLAIYNEFGQTNIDALVMYTSTVKLAVLVETIFSKLYASSNDAKFTAMIDEMYFTLPVFLTPHACGEMSVKESYKAFLLSSKYLIEKTPREEQEVLRPPSSYNPATYGQQPPQTFDPKSCQFFKISGKKEV